MDDGIVSIRVASEFNSYSFLARNSGYGFFWKKYLRYSIMKLKFQKPRDSPMESFLQPLNSSLWSALFISVLFVGCAIFLLDLYSPFDRFFRVDKSRIDPDDPFLEPTEDDRLDFGEAMWFVWGVLLNSGVSESLFEPTSGIIWQFGAE